MCKKAVYTDAAERL